MGLYIGIIQRDYMMGLRGYPNHSRNVEGFSQHSNDKDFFGHYPSVDWFHAGILVFNHWFRDCVFNPPEICFAEQI